MQSQEIVDIITAACQNKGLSLNIGRTQVMAITQQQCFKMQIHGTWAQFETSLRIKSFGCPDNSRYKID